MPINFDYHPCQGRIDSDNAYLRSCPTAPLNQWLQEFWQLNVPSGHYAYRSIPDNCVDLIINLHAPEDAFIVCPFSKAHVFDMTGPVTYFGIRFRPLGQGGIIATAVGEWSNSAKVIGAAELLPHSLLDRLYPIAGQAMSFDQRCAAIGKVLLDACQPCDIDARLKRYLIYCNQQAHSALHLSDQQCSEFGLSPRQLRRLTSLYLGLSPKAFSRVVRFQQSLGAINSATPSAQWAKGYYDQPHFIREFKAMSGVTPGKFNKLSVLYNTD